MRTQISGSELSFRFIIKSLASLRLAVLIMLALGVAIAVGTFVEARLDATAAQKLVYHSWWMQILTLALTASLIAVMVDRWPWQKKHIGFILAHIGIIVLMLGSTITTRFGIDGSMSLAYGERADRVVLPQTDLIVYTSLDGSSYRKLFEREVDFFMDPPTLEKPLSIDIPGGALKITDYMPYAFQEQKILESKEESAGAGVRFQLQNANVNLTEWMLQPAIERDVVKDLGPAQVILTRGEFKNVGNRNALVLRPKAGNSEKLEYEVHTARKPGQIKKGEIAPGDSIETGWMGLVLRLLKYMPQAREQLTFKKTDAPTPLTTAAVEIDFNGTKRWSSIGSMTKLFSDQAVYLVTYSNRRLEVPVKLRLKEFRVGRYQGTLRAASYESLVDVEGLGEQLISMNEPLKHEGFTFYQSSFSEDESGQPVLSILSVNRDPGRWLKYLGSLLIVLGTIHLFYFKRRAAKAKPGDRAEERVGA